MPNTVAENSAQKIVHVAVGVIRNQQDQILLALRAKESHQGGLWEFPGGKVEAGESVSEALSRELQEELASQVTQCFPFCRIQHDYSDKSVLLDVWLVTEFEGEPLGAEGQPLCWQPISQLSQLDFPKANIDIIRLLQLPDVLAITPKLAAIDQLDILFQNYQSKGVKMVQLRQPHLSKSDFLLWLGRAKSLALESGITLFANCSAAVVKGAEGEGIRNEINLHLNSTQLRRVNERPFGNERFLSASCHSAEELQIAEAIGVDFALVSPIFPTKHYSAADCLGWDGFAELSKQTQLPLYALGGMDGADSEHIFAAKLRGGAGIAAVRSVANLD